MAPWATYAKMLIFGGGICIGGPYLVYYVTPTEEELFSRYNPELQRRSLENRRQKQEDFDQFVRKLKEYSKSDKPIWEAAAEDDEREREGQRRAQRELVQEEERVKEERKAQMREALRK